MHNSDFMAVKRGHFSQGLVCYFDTCVDCQHEHHFSVVQERLLLRGIGRVSLINQVDPELADVVENVEYE